MLDLGRMTWGYSCSRLVSGLCGGMLALRSERGAAIGGAAPHPVSFPRPAPVPPISDTPPETPAVRLQLMREEGIAPNEYSYTAALNACAARGQWERALGMLREMQEAEGLRPNDFAYTAAVSRSEGACSTPQRRAWEAIPE